MSIKPIGERVVARAVKEVEKTAGGIILTVSFSKESSNIVEVVAVGLGEKVSKEIKVGDKIIYTGYGATKIKDHDEELMIIDFENILGIID